MVSSTATVSMPMREELRDGLAAAVERCSADFLLAWEGELAKTTIPFEEVTVQDLLHEAHTVLRQLPSRLRGQTNPARRSTNRRGYVMGAGVSTGRGSGLTPLTRWRLQEAFVSLLWRMTAAELPQDWPLSIAWELEKDLRDAVGRIVGASQRELQEQAEMAALAERRVLRETVSHLLMAQEEERRRMAREVHDVVAQALASARLRADSTVRLLDQDLEQAKVEAAETMQLVKYTLSHVREIIYDLRPMTLDRFGLRAAIEEYAARVQGNGSLKVKVMGNGGAERLPPEVETCLFRTIQAVLKVPDPDGRAGTATITFDIGTDEAKLIVEHEEPAQEPETEGEHGASSLTTLAALRYQIESLGGRYDYVADRHGPRRVEVVVPASR